MSPDQQKLYAIFSLDRSAPGLRSYIRQPDQPPLTWADAEAINVSPKLRLVDRL
jgi:hypothetical protein